MKRIVTLFLSLALVLSLLTGCASKKKVDSNLPLSGKRIAYIMYVVPSDIFNLAANAAKKTAEALGATCDVYFTDLDNTRFQDTVMACANQGYDAMLLTHSNQESALRLVTELRKRDIEVCCFDTQFVDENGNFVNGSIEGVTQMFQDDGMMVRMLLDYLLSLYPEKVAKKEPIKLLKIWRGPGIAVFDRRNEVYQEYEKAGKIVTLETLGPADPKNAEASMIEVMAATLPKYKKGEVDGIWSTFDAYARGAYVAMREANRTDIPLVSVDISNQDINFMMDGSEVWQASACVDFTTIGEQGIRILAMKLMGDSTEAVYEMVPSLVTYDKLKPGTNVLNLKDIVPGYGVNNDHLPEWMQKYISKK